MDKKSLERIKNIFENARLDGRTALYETEGLDILDELGFRVPARVFVTDSETVDSINLSRFEGDRVVVKIVSDTILHKTDVGGVKIVPKNHNAIRGAFSQIRSEAAEKAGLKVCGFTTQAPYNLT